ncbi:alcohol dehydrogenase, putative [Leishmania tarentolae]|uniref:Alcohol dehydrogenase, putative n=1 Tax=Leishmania tarentolae TaxID=5689 RepID=A0A640KP68_LEITA|nr:alcohol dehydrogenase, putative [Leishmania tarentolae]
MTASFVFCCGVANDSGKGSRTYSSCMLRWPPAPYPWRGARQDILVDDRLGPLLFHLLNEVVGKAKLHGHCICGEKPPLQLRHRTGALGDCCPSPTL